jgi:type II secretory pathway pseudopilin PulG
MRRNELTIVLSLAIIGLIVAVWLVVLGPKRDQAASLKKDVDQLQSQLEYAQQAAAAGAEEQKSFPADYRKLVVLGKAVPEDGDQASLLVQLQQLADRSGVGFQSIDLADAGSATTPAPAPATSTSPTSSTSTSSTATGDTSATSTPTSTTSASSAGSTGAVPTQPTPDATEASAATLPIGASVGPAGLGVMPYELTFTGQFFQIADFMKRLDAMVHTRQGTVSVDGRLLTVDAFTLAPIQSSTNGDTFTLVPTLTADLSVTTYVTPPDQGITAGATPTGPAPAATTPVSTASSTATSTPTSSSVPGSAGPTATSP